jgi:hypothetical protein
LLKEELITAEVTGSNLKGLMSLDMLDKNRLTSNNMHVLASVIGIEAAQEFFIDDLNQILSNYGLHPQHILTVAYLFFSKGIPTGAAHNSVNKPYGPIDKATVSKAVDILKLSALQGLNHDVNGISTSIVFGIAPKIGTNYSDIGYEVEPNKFLLNKDIYTVFKHNFEEEPIITPHVNEDFHNIVNNQHTIPTHITKPQLVGRKLGFKPTANYKATLDHEPITMVPKSKYDIDLEDSQEEEKEEDNGAEIEEKEIAIKSVKVPSKTTKAPVTKTLAKNKAAPVKKKYVDIDEPIKTTKAAAKKTKYVKK